MARNHHLARSGCLRRGVIGLIVGWLALVLFLVESFEGAKSRLTSNLFHRKGNSTPQRVARTSSSDLLRSLDVPRLNTSPAFRNRAHHAIPRQLLLNFGMWDSFSIAEGGADGFDLSAHPLRVLELPMPEQERVSYWLETHPPPQWRIRIWDKRSADSFVHVYFPGLLGIYLNYSKIVQRADLLRVLLLAQFGGLYLDIDIRPRALGALPLEDLWAAFPSATALVFEENVLSENEARSAAISYPIRGGKIEECQRIANYLMAFAPLANPQRLNQEFLERMYARGPSLIFRIIQLMRLRATLALHTDYDVLYTTGPALITEAVYAHALAELERSLALSGAAVRTDNAVPSTCVLASDMLRAARQHSTPPSNAEHIEVVRRPFDQRFFDHISSGTWREARLF